MTDRIRELAIQTDIWCDQNVAIGSIQYNNLWERKFAELIIKETLEAARAGIEFGSSMEEFVYQYFGVNE